MSISPPSSAAGTMMFAEARERATAVAGLFARAKRLPAVMQQESIELPDASSTDGSPARRSRLNVRRYLAGDRSRTALLRADLTAWRDNEAAFALAAAGRPLLEAALPTGCDVGALADFGLTALEAPEAGRPLPQEEKAGAEALVTKLDNYEAQSRCVGAMLMKKAPPTDLIVLVTSDVARLVSAAANPVAGKAAK